MYCRFRFSKFVKEQALRKYLPVPKPSTTSKTSSSFTCISREADSLIRNGKVVLQTFSTTMSSQPAEWRLSAASEDFKFTASLKVLTKVESVLRQMQIMRKAVRATSTRTKIQVRNVERRLRCPQQMRGLRVTCSERGTFFRLLSLVKNRDYKCEECLSPACALVYYYLLVRMENLQKEIQ